MLLFLTDVNMATKHRLVNVNQCHLILVALASVYGARKATEVILVIAGSSLCSAADRHRAELPSLLDCHIIEV